MIFLSLKREQREAIGLLQIGTFLEYFDLMLYVHMAVLLNELFFPKTDPHTASLITALAFCSTFILRPFGALVFGYIGDNIGRKTTVIITTAMMSTSCIIMANLPTYAEIGIAAAWIVTLCRVVQGFSSMGEIMGAQIYVTEITKPPAQYPAVSFISLASAVGSSAALGIAFLVTSIELNWRIAFWIGAGIAVVGSVARTRLRETPEFVDMKRRRQKEIEEELTDDSAKSLKMNHMKKMISREKVNKKTFLASFIIHCGWPISFYITYMYFNPTLKNLYGYSSEDIIFHNFLLSVILIISSTSWAIWSYRKPPMEILKIRGCVFLILAFLLPILILGCKSNSQIFILQAALLIFNIGESPGSAIFIKHFPVFRRFTAASFVYAVTRALMYIVTSFGLVYLTEWVGHFGLWFIMLPVTMAYLWGIQYFRKLEKEFISHSSRDSCSPKRTLNKQPEALEAPFLV